MEEGYSFFYLSRLYFSSIYTFFYFDNLRSRGDGLTPLQNLRYSRYTLNNIGSLEGALQY